MTVNMGTQTYEMSRKQAKAILVTAKKFANCNIYGIEKGNVVIMLDEKYADDMSLKKAVGEYKQKGFNVHIVCLLELLKGNIFRCCSCISVWILFNFYHSHSSFLLFRLATNSIC